MFDAAVIAVNPERYVQKKKDVELEETIPLGERLTERLTIIKMSC